MLNKLKQMKLKAMKDKDVIAKSILSVMHCEALVIAKKELRDVSDSDIITVSKSLIKKNEQTIELLTDKTNTWITLTKEIIILEQFLPKQMTDGEIKYAVYELLLDMKPEELIRKNQGNIMKQLKDIYGDNINMGTASKYVSNKLS